MADDQVAELRGDKQFPLDTALKPQPLDAYQFAGSGGGPQFSFGMDRAKASEMLREIADRIESGEYVLQSGGVFTYAQRDDYVMSVVNVKFHAKRV